MTFPQRPEKYKLAELFGAQDLVAYRKQIGRMPRLESPSSILFCLERGLPWRLRRKFPILRAGGMNGDLYALKKPKGKIGIMTGFGGGSPMTAELAEEFAAMGARRMILMTWGGTLQPELDPGDIVVVDKALRDEGTSYHYLPPARYVEADSGLADELMEAIRRRGGSCQRGATWTTDAPYRETAEEIRQYQVEGIQTVELESAGLFTIGQVRGIATCSAVIAMDSLAGLKWEAPSRLDEILRSLELVYAAALDVLRQAS